MKYQWINLLLPPLPCSLQMRLLQTQGWGNTWQFLSVSEFSVSPPYRKFANSHLKGNSVLIFPEVLLLGLGSSGCSVLRSCVWLWKARVFSSLRPEETHCKSGAGSWRGACCAAQALWSPGPWPGTPSTQLLEGAQPGAVRHMIVVSRAGVSRSSHFAVQINQFSCSRILFPGWEYCGPNRSSLRSLQDLNAVL